MNHQKNHADSSFMDCQKDIGKKQQPQQQKRSNNLMSLHKVLNNLENDNLKRYNNESSQFSQQNYSKCNFKTQKITNKNNQDNETTPFKFIIEPEPWFNENDTSQSKRSKNISYALRSFHLSLPKTFLNQKFTKNNYRSSSTINPSNLSTLRDEDIQKRRRLNQTVQSKEKLLTKTFQYTNEQKAKVSTAQLAHEKQHKKIERILKYKLDKNSLKQQKIKEHSQFLIEALKNLTFDDLIPERKKSSLKIEGNKRIKTQTEQQKLQNDHFRTISCGKLQNMNQMMPKLTYFPDQVKYTVKRFEPEMIKIDLPNKDKQNHKVYRPKRNWVFERSSISQKNFNEICQNQAKKYRERVESVSSHFLKINKIQK